MSQKRPSPHDSKVIAALTAAQLYYMQAKTMEVIARELGTSRSSVSRLLGYARETGLVDIRINSPLERLGILEERIRDIFAAMVEHDVALELNTSGIRKPFASFLPCPEVWQWSLEYPLRRVYGSDAHKPEFVASDLAAAQKLFA